MKKNLTNQRFHINVGDKRTTISLDNTLSELLSLKLNTVPYSDEAHRAIRQLLQGWIDRADDPGRIYVSQWIRGEAILYITDKILSERYGEWVMQED